MLTDFLRLRLAHKDPRRRKEWTSPTSVNVHVASRSCQYFSSHSSVPAASHKGIKPSSPWKPGGLGVRAQTNTVARCFKSPRCNALESTLRVNLYEASQH